MGSADSIDAVLLAGGKSSRFGSDKAFLEWRGQRLFERQLERLRDLHPQNIWLSANPDQDFETLAADVEIVVDETPEMGPMGGLISAFRRSRADRVVVLGVDLPLMESNFLQELVDAGGGQVPRSNRFWEPLAAVYPRVKMLAHLEEAAAKGERKLQHLLEQAFEEGWIGEHPVRESEALLFTNLNATRDLSVLSPKRFDDEIELQRFRVDKGWSEDVDFVAAEEPLEVRVNGRSVSVMMRTPGHDEELATGFLYTESIIEAASEILEISHLPDVDRQSDGNTLEVRLAGDPDLSELTRHVFTSSSCGVCGKATIDSVFQQFPPIQSRRSVSSEFLLELPNRLRAAQKTFDRTGGLHASALFSLQGDLLVLREDVGRHNALDKVIGRGLQDNLDFSEVVLLVSGRISFELMQKSLSAGIPIVAGISAPSSLAVKLAKDSGQTLVGFLRERGLNLYSGKLDSSS
jgi:FdhD protein